MSSPWHSVLWCFARSKEMQQKVFLSSLMEFTFCLCDKLCFALTFFSKIILRSNKQTNKKQKSHNPNLFMLFNDATWAIFVIFVCVHKCLDIVAYPWIWNSEFYRVCYENLYKCDFVVYVELCIKFQIICTSFLLLQNVFLLSCVLANCKDTGDLKDLKALKGSCFQQI